MGTYIRLVDFNNSTEKEEQFFNQENRHQANQKEFEKIPGSPVAYWVSDRVKEIFEKSEKLGDVGEGKQGLATADNDRFLRFWSEVDIKNSKMNCENGEEALASGKKWFPYNKGGEKRKWYGNQEFLVNWEKDGYEIKNFCDDKGKIRSVVRNPTYYFRESISWSDITSSGNSFRVFPKGFIYDVTGMSYFIENREEELLLLGVLNNKLISELTKIINPTLHLQIGDFVKLPYLPIENKELSIENLNLDLKEKFKSLVQQNISISKQEWDSRETSWDFEANGLTFFPKKTIGTSPSTTTEDSGQVFVEKNQGDNLDIKRVNLISQAYEDYCKTWKENFHQMHKNEEELNRLFIEIYGLQDEMDESVSFKDITLLKKETQILEIDTPPSTKEEIEENEKTVEGYLYNRGVILDFSQEELVKQLLSYGIGCIMGRYSLDKKGLIIANSDDGLVTGENSFSVLGADGEVRHEILNPKFIPEPFGIIPVVKENIFSNDIVEKIREFVTAVYGKETLEENLEFIADSLGRKGNESSRDTLRKYFIKDFYKDHLQRYKKRPIYWMMNSGKKDAFSALIYLHRHENNTIGRVRADYLVKYQETLDRYKDYYDRLVTDSETVPKDRKEAEKKLKELDGELKELRDYANEVKHIADLKISLDLDDGVKVNYEKLGKILGKI